METSKKFRLNNEDLKKIGKGLLIAIGGAVMTYLSEVVLKTDFGAYTPVIVATWSVIVNIGNKYFSGK